MIHHSRPFLDSVDLKYLSTVLESEMISEGELTTKFENQCAEYLGHDFAISTVSGTQALVLALLGVGIGSGDQVILPTYICANVLKAIKSIGAIPLLSDIGMDWVLTAENIEPLLSDKVKGIILNHTFGIKADVRTIMKFGIPVIEDCCQAFSPQIGCEADVAIYSFNATKCLTTGEGGLVATSSEVVLDRIIQYRDSLLCSPRLSNLQSALGLSQLDRYGLMLDVRKKIALRYIEEIHSSLVSNVLKREGSSVFFRFPLRIVEDFTELQSKYESFGVAVRRGVDQLVHRIIGLDDALFPNAVTTFNSTLSIPIYPALSEDDQLSVIEATKKVFCG